MITHPEGGVDDRPPDWSPDGRRITFASSGVDGQPDILTMRADGTGVRPVTQTLQWDSAPDWGARPCRR